MNDSIVKVLFYNYAQDTPYPKFKMVIGYPDEIIKHADLLYSDSIISQIELDFYYYLDTIQKKTYDSIEVFNNYINNYISNTYKIIN